jgi:molybdate transport system ATP-binding protein
MDNPFIGLDTNSRIVLREVLENLAKIENLQIILLISDTADIPPIITHILPIKDKTVLPPLSYTEFLSNKEIQNKLFPPETKSFPFPSSSNNKEKTTFKNALILHNVTIRYGERTILKNLSWQVKKGEKWALLGPNGSGKSTLLSLIAADNPQAYANDITLFDRKRGTGES